MCSYLRDSLCQVNGGPGTRRESRNPIHTRPARVHKLRSKEQMQLIYPGSVSTWLNFSKTNFKIDGYA